MRRAILTFLYSLTLFLPLAAQIPDSISQTEPPLELSDKDSVKNDLPVDDPRRFSLAISRSFLSVPNSFLAAQDTAPLSGNGSGTLSIGAGFMVPFGRNILGLRIAPSWSMTTFEYSQTEAKTFPSLTDENQPLVSEKHRLHLIELPVGLYWNITRDEDSDPLIFLEAGGYAAYVLGAQYRVRYESANRSVSERYRGLEQEGDFLRYRYGIYARLGYKWAAVFVKYRLSDVFDEFANTQYRPSGYRNPAVPPLELGVSLLW